jgi:hypothetical protein
VISISTLRVKLNEAVSSIWPGTHKGAKGNRFGGNAGKNIKGVSRNNIREVGNYGNAVSGIGSIVRRGVNGRRGMRKSRGRFRT